MVLHVNLVRSPSSAPSPGTIKVLLETCFCFLRQHVPNSITEEDNRAARLHIPTPPCQAAASKEFTNKDMQYWRTLWACTHVPTYTVASEVA